MGLSIDGLVGAVVSADVWTSLSVPPQRGKHGRPNNALRKMEEAACEGGEEPARADAATPFKKRKLLALPTENVFDEAPLSAAENPHEPEREMRNSECVSPREGEVEAPPTTSREATISLQQLDEVTPQVGGAAQGGAQEELESGEPREKTPPPVEAPLAPPPGEWGCPLGGTGAAPVALLVQGVS